MEYITEKSDSAKEKIGTKCFFCTYTDKFFRNEEELAECFNVKFHNSPYGCCWACDRKEYTNHKSHNLHGLNMKPFFKDPIVAVEFSELQDNLKIKREIE